MKSNGFKITPHFPNFHKSLHYDLIIEEANIITIQIYETSLSSLDRHRTVSHSILFSSLFSLSENQFDLNILKLGDLDRPNAICYDSKSAFIMVTLSYKFFFSFLDQQNSGEVVFPYLFQSTKDQCLFILHVKLYLLQHFSLFYSYAEILTPLTFITCHKV